MLWCSGVGALTIAASAEAEMQLTRAQINAYANRVELISPSGAGQIATREDCFCAGDALKTEAFSRAELVFNDGSLARLGELSQLSFWPQTRQLRLHQGTALLFVPPQQGRLFVQTPTAVTGIQNNAAVVRYVPSTGLTLVLALAHANPGAVSITTNTHPQQEIALAAGQMAFIDATGIQVVEFDLLEFYATSRLIEGVNPMTGHSFGDAHRSVALLQPALLAAIEYQNPFTGSSPVLNPAMIRVGDEPPRLFGQEEFSPVPPVVVSEGVRHYDDAPPGVITPLPEIEPTEPPASSTSGEPTLDPESVSPNNPTTAAREDSATPQNGSNDALP
jgi:hypothetical protein